MSLLLTPPPYENVEQALLGSALKLRSTNLERIAAINAPVDNAIVELSRIADAIKISPIAKTSIVSIEARFFYDSFSALNAGFDVFDALIPFSSQDIIYYIPCTRISGTYAPYPTLPVEVKTLEQYFLYNLYLLVSSTHPTSYVTYETFDVPEGKSIPSVLAKVSLPFDFKRFSRTRSLLDSLTKVCTSYVLPFFGGIVYRGLNNAFPVNNFVAFKN
ncbi:MAG: hypothetical protein ACRC6M_03285 [Microcystaceae cyanobacterium]